MNIVTISEKAPIPTSSFPDYAKFPFEKFNPVQSAVVEVHDKDGNALIASSTGSGKTLIAEMYISHEARIRGGKAMYLGPMKALTKEKVDDWTDPGHHFNDLKLSICTGDYRLTPQRKKELNEADIILMTPEMLSSRIRNYKAESNDFLKEVKTLIVDEFHVTTVPSRGDHVEVALMKFTKINPDARIVALSATMPNVKELAEWVSLLNGKTTYLIESDYRPVPIHIHYPTYRRTQNYEYTELQKVNAALELVEKFPNDKFLIFAHTKRTGQMMKKLLLENGHKCEFHNADLEKEQRHQIENVFRAGDLRIIVATSTLAWGNNFPARRVILLGIHRGQSEVATYDIHQSIGRAGRPGYDTRGDAYILVPENDADAQIERIENKQDIESRLLDKDGVKYKTLAFHLVSEIHHGEIRNKEDVLTWYERSLANHQANDLHDSIIKSTLESLIKCGAIKIEDNEYKATTTGIVASMFYFSPFDVADLKNNLVTLFGKQLEDNDLAIAMALGAVDSNRQLFVSKPEQAEIDDFKRKVMKVFGARFIDQEIKAGFAYFCLLNGLDAGAVSAYSRNLLWDFDRLIEVTKTIDSMICNWGKHTWFDRLGLRVNYGVSEELVDLCLIPDIGKARAEKLWAAGVRTIKDVASRGDQVQRTLNLKPDKIAQICDAAKELLLNDLIGK
jgi:replicative superfamily II helicase